jgi:hypothetical protein
MKIFLEKIVHTVIPHEKNKNIPHLLTEEFIFVLVVFVGILFYFNQNNFDIIKKLKLTATVYPAVLADLTNQDRGLNGVTKLNWSPTLEKAAKLKAEDMLENSYFAHTSPSGLTPWHWLNEVNYNFVYAGENLAVDFTESQNVENAWLNSPKHKENIMNSNFTEIGIATVDGVFEGKQTTFVVQFFGKPSEKETQEKPVINEKVVVEKIDKITIPGVAGVFIEDTVKEDNLKVVEESKDFIVVQDENIVEEKMDIFSNDLEMEPLSTWYERLIFNPKPLVLLIYKIILGLVSLCTLLMLTKKYEKHHTKHLAFSIIIIILIVTLLIFISTK